MNVACDYEAPMLMLTTEKYIATHSATLKDYRYHDFPNTEFSYFLTIDTRQ